MIVVSKYKISEEDYNELLNCSQEKIDNYVINIANNSPYKPCGYGFYSSKIFKEEDEYFVSWEHWDSCD